MKKLTSSLFAVALLGAGVATVPAAAQAAPYPGGENSVNTKCFAYAVGKPHAGSTAKIRVEVTAPGALTGDPHGWVDVNAEKLNGKNAVSGRYFTRGGAVIFNLGPMRAGNYTGSVSFDSRPGDSKFQDCASGFTFKVRRNH